MDIINIKKLTVKLISILACGSLLLGLCSCGTNELPSDSTDVKGTKQVKLSGTFIQSWLCSTWSDERWALELTNLKDLGMDIVVLGDSAVKSTAGKWTAFYPSELDGLKDGYLGSDTIDNALRNCQKFGFKVFVGMSLDEKWWDKFVYDEEWLYSAMNKCNDIADELYKNYHEKYSDAFYGWYWNPEIWNAEVFKPTSAVREKSIKTLSTGMNICLDHLNELSPDMPFMFSPFANTEIGSADDNYLFWKDLFNSTHFRKFDILCPMDSVGAGGTKIQYLDKWFEAYSKAVTETGKLKFWSNCEDFDYTTANEACTADMGRFSKQMEITSKYCEKIITFAYSHYYSPYNAVEGYNATYKDYIENGRLEQEPPTVPSDFKAEIENNVAVLSWNASTDNLGIAGYNVYRNGNLMETIRAELSNNASVAPEIGTYTTDWDALDLIEKSGNVTYSVAAVDCAGNESEKAEYILK